MVVVEMTKTGKRQGKRQSLAATAVVLLVTGIKGGLVE